MKILVTGGAGFIGSHLANYYVDLGHEVFVTDNYEQAGDFELDPSIEKVWCDLRDLEGTRNMVWDIMPELINHQAALIDPRESMRRPGRDGHANYVGTANLLDAMAEYERKKFIFASSCAIYGNPPPNIPMIEGAYELPECPYGASKLAAEKLIRVFSAHREIKSVVLRYPNIYGPDQSGQRGTGIIAIFARRMARNEDIVVFGSGEASYQYLYMDDLLDAHRRATDWLETPSEVPLIGEKEPIASRFLLCNLPGENRTVMEIAETLKKSFKKYELSKKITFMLPRMGEQSSITMTGEGALQELGWRMSVKLDSGISAVAKAAKREAKNG